jgi:hypothetical protein
MIPTIPEEIDKVMQYTRDMSDWITQLRTPTLVDLENAESQIANSLAFLNEETEKYQYLYDTCKESYEASFNDAFHNMVYNEKASAAVAKIDAKISCKELAQDVIEAKYLYKVLKAFCASRKDVLTSLCHRIKTIQNQSKSGYGT